MITRKLTQGFLDKLFTWPRVIVFLPTLTIFKACRPNLYSVHFTTMLKPTVSLGVTSAVVCTYGYDDGRILPTRCAIIDAGLDGRCRRRRTRRTSPAAARSARNALAAGLRPVSTADPGAFPRSRTTPPGGIRPCGDASPPRSAPGIRPCPPRLCLV